ncbi:hypothetical protein [Bordetella pertussis]|nr:hypothetical protein [Bordetella pertussis]
MFIHRKSHRVRVGRRVHRVPASGRHCWRGALYPSPDSTWTNTTY